MKSKDHKQIFLYVFILFLVKQPLSFLLHGTAFHVCLAFTLRHSINLIIQEALSAYSVPELVLGTSLLDLTLVHKLSLLRITFPSGQSNRFLWSQEDLRGWFNLP